MCNWTVENWNFIGRAAEDDDTFLIGSLGISFIAKKDKSDSSEDKSKNCESV